MSVTVSVTGDAAGQLRAWLGEVDKRTRYAAATALTRAANQAKSEVRVEMASTFDRPTPYALNSLRVDAAKKDKLWSRVWFKDRTGAPQAKDTNYMVPEVFGGRRGRKAFETRLMQVGWLRSNEFLVPTAEMDLDAFGNVPASVIRSILSQAQASGGLGYSSNKADSKRSRRTVARVGTYFVSRGYSSGSPLPRGIYQRRRFGFGWGSRMIFTIVAGRPSYQQRLRLLPIAQRVMSRDFEAEFRKAFEQQAARWQ